MEIEKRKNYFREYYKSRNKSKLIPYETNEITMKLYEIQSKYIKNSKLRKMFVIYFYRCLGLTNTQIRDYLDVDLGMVIDVINNINSDALVWRSDIYYIQKEIKDFANEYKAKI